MQTFSNKNEELPTSKHLATFNINLYHNFGYEKNHFVKLSDDCNLEKITASFKKKFQKIEFFQINDLNKILSNISKKKFIIDRHTCSYYFEDVITKKNYVLNFQDPIYDFKSVKNNIEIIIDGK